jgi:hypothetical protein
VHAIEDGVVSTTPNDSASDCGALLPDHLCEMQEVTDSFRWRCNAVQATVQGFLIVPVIHGILKSGSIVVSIGIRATSNGNVLSISTSTLGAIGRLARIQLSLHDLTYRMCSNFVQLPSLAANWARVAFQAIAEAEWLARALLWTDTAVASRPLAGVAAAVVAAGAAEEEEGWV